MEGKKIVLFQTYKNNIYTLADNNYSNEFLFERRKITMFEKEKTS